MTNWHDFLNVISANMWGGLLSTLFAVLVGTNFKAVGLRNYILILAMSLLATGVLIELFLVDATLFRCCLLGFGVGLVADNVFMTLDATLPNFVESAIKDTLAAIKDKLNAFLGKKDG